MFYSDSFSEAYRMGDIVSGYTEIIPVYSKNKENNKLNLSISIVSSDFFVILTPCCSIENEIVNIVPLRKLDSKFLSSSQLIADFLLINQPIPKRSAIGDLAFSRLTPHEQLEVENALPEYAYIDKFIYDNTPYMIEYELTKKRGKNDEVTVTTGKYMISFKDAVKIQSSLFERSRGVYAKVAELTPHSRQELRDKLSYYYSRVPEEDQPFLA